jgi:uncharacterized Zn finger protein
MSALHAHQTSGRRRPRVHLITRCSICSDTMVAPEVSVLKSDGEVSYLWSCDRCGHGFVTEARVVQLRAGPITSR